MSISKFFIVQVVVGMVVIGGSIVPGTAYASCVLLSTEQQKEMADIVAVGTVSDVNNGIAAISVREYFKGDGPEQIVATGQEEPGFITSVDVEWQEGTEYLLFLKGTVQEIMSTTVCAGTRVLENGLTQEEQAALGISSTPLKSEQKKVGTPGMLFGFEFPSQIPSVLLNPWILIGLLAWALPWKGVALWKAAQRRQGKWFVALLLINTLAVLEILYLFVFSKEKEPELQQ